MSGLATWVLLCSLAFLGVGLWAVSEAVSRVENEGKYSQAVILAVMFTLCLIVTVSTIPTAYLSLQILFK